MRRLLLQSIPFVVLTTVSGISYGQSLAINPYQNRIIQRHFGPEIEKIQTDCPALMNELVYYYTASFEVEMINCNSCQVNLDSLFNYHLFDVSSFEYLRLPDGISEINYKDIYSIKLRSSNELNSARQLIYQAQPLELPVFVSTGQLSDDYSAYKAELNTWRNEHPYRFKVAMNNSEISVMKESEFLNLPAQKIASFIGVPNGYLIID